MSFNSQEITSKTLDTYFNKTEDEKKEEVIELPKVEDYELGEKEDVDIHEYEPPKSEPESFPEPPKCELPKSIFGGGQNEPKKNNTGSIFDGGRAKYFLYGLMGLGLASQVLK
jgi:hypothetical protein